MSLDELSQGYVHAAKLLRDRLALIRKELKETTDPEEIFQLQRRSAILTPMLTEMNTLAELTARYYEGGYYRDEKYSANCFRECFSASKEAKRNFDENYPDRADGSPEGYVCPVLLPGHEDRTDCDSQRREQKYRKSYSQESRAENTSDYPVPVKVLDKFFK